ncbi:restriction endonuclease subunit S [Vibrio diabolicus]|uniref:restriction endonuclease subunit S n=1 Tax=Vibrio diabolicus TaxID=50719 RepID=UPI00375540A6|nr:restriction endonuclease subunit S [Vibrio parahaemolyticus]MCF9547966.1 restriction endonuclease subunit S [Vibrio parahaemolyticus]MDG2677232.1 restriction endonuclease subunit S [Vibrio parahaemolyticus]
MTGRYKAYPDYKESGIDWLYDIPAHWKTIPVGRCYHRVKRTGFESEELLSVYRDHGVIPKSSRDDNNNKASDDLSPYQLVCENNLVMNKMKAWQGSIAISEYRGIVSPAYFVYEPFKHTESIVYPKYVHYLLRHPIYITQYMSRSKGIRVNQWDLDPESFQSIELLLPLKEEQQKIINFLDHETTKIDILIDKQEQLIELLKEKRQAVISHAVTKGLSPDAKMKDSGVEWLGEVPEHWKGTALKYITNIYGRIGFRGYTTNDIVEEGNGAITMSPSNISNGVVSFDKATYISWEKYYESPEIQLQKDDVVLVKTGSTLGKAGYIDKLICPTTLNPQLAVFKESSCCNKWLYYFLNTTLAKAYVNNSNSGGTVPTMSQEKILSYIAPTPPLKEQGEIAAYLDLEISKIDDLITKMNTMVDLINERKTALISAAVTGRIDVRDWQESA